MLNKLNHCETITLFGRLRLNKAAKCSKKANAELMQVLAVRGWETPKPQALLYRG